MVPAISLDTAGKGELTTYIFWIVEEVQLLRVGRRSRGIGTTTRESSSVGRERIGNRLQRRSTALLADEGEMGGSDQLDLRPAY